MSLNDYSAAFAQFLRAGHTQDIAAFCDTGSNLAALSVYRNGFYKACIDALSGNFPAVLALVGEDCFKTLARDYVDQHPPTHGSLVGYGARFPAFLADRQAQHRLTYLAAIAAVDRAWLTVYFASDVEPASGDTIAERVNQGIDVTELRLSLCPATAMVDADYALFDVWRSLKEHGRLARRTRIESVPQSILLWRQQATVYCRALAPSSPEFAFLTAISRGQTLGGAAVHAAEYDPEFDLATVFADLLSNGLLYFPTGS